MLDFEEAAQLGFEALTEIVSVNSLSEIDRKVAGLQEFSCVFRISTEVFYSCNSVKAIILLMALPKDFPFALPKIYISKQDKKWIGFIPHIDTAGYVCLFDEESIIVDFHRPGEIAKTCLYKSLQIIEQGLKGDNQNDFSDEFIAYWTEKFDEKDKIYPGLMMLEQIPSEVTGLIKFLTIEKPYSGYHIILYDGGATINRFKEFLNNRGHRTVEREGLYLGSVENLYPPFNFSNADTYRIIKDHFPQSLKNFERYINQTTKHRLIVFSVVFQTQYLFFGCYITDINTNRNGYRCGRLTPLNVFNTFQRNDRVIRLHFEAYTKERLTKRTNGVATTAKYAITFAGLGSIGSNLISYLSSLDIDSFHLIDPEILTLANINRHLLGPDDIGKPKAEGIRDCLIKSNPLIHVAVHNESIIQYIKNNSKELNHSDYLFITIGKNVVENYVLESLQENQILIPTFIIWIEPYLIGGHCLYLQPGHTLTYNGLYEDHLFRYNVVNASEYKNSHKQILLREAGCQGSYMPYSQKSIILFLSSLVPYLFQIIDNKDKRNISLTWRGKAPIDISLELSAYGRKLKVGDINLNEL